MTDPSQYFKGRTVQEQMNEVIGYVDVRSAEVATDAIASDVAQVHSDAADAHADALAAAASAAAAAGTLTNAVKKTGEASQSIDGDIDLNDDLNVDGDATIGGALAVTGAVTVPTPVNNTDAATKKYVDDQDALDVHLTGAQTVAGVKTFSSSPVVPTEATGTFSTKAANSTKIKDEIDNYGMVVRTSGNQTISGIKTFNSTITRNGGDVHNLIEDITSKKITSGEVWYAGRIRFYDSDNVEIGRIFIRANANGTTTLGIEVRNSDGTLKFISLGTGDVI